MPNHVGEHVPLSGAADDVGREALAAAGGLDGFADGRGGDLAFFAAVFFNQQRYAQLFFQCLYGFADGGLGQVKCGFGTSRAGPRHETEGVMASLTMILAGLFMVIIGPSMVHWVVWLMG